MCYWYWFLLLPTDVSSDGAKDEDEDDDIAYYRQEVGEEPEPGRITFDLSLACSTMNYLATLCYR